jgi:pimeloyl-ACP methyl ester carboxylesterase
VVVSFSSDSRYARIPSATKRAYVFVMVLSIIISRIIQLQSRRRISTNLLAIVLLQAECVCDRFNYFRAFPQDAIQNVNYSKTKLLTTPVLAIGEGYIPAFGGNVTINCAFYGMDALAQNVRGIQVPNSSHWIPEECPDLVIKLLDNFFGGSTANAIK